MDEHVTVILGFDMETDVGSWTPFYEGLVHGTPALLEALAAEGATGTFFFTGDAARKHPETVRAVVNAGHEVGCHSLYHETVGEALFEAGLHPLRKANTLSRDETERLHGAIRGVLQRAIDNRGTTLADGGYVDADRQPGRNQHSLRVYHRHGQACWRCGQTIERIKVHGRGTHFCTGCQR